MECSNIISCGISHQWKDEVNIQVATTIVCLFYKVMSDSDELINKSDTFHPHFRFVIVPFVSFCLAMVKY